MRPHTHYLIGALLVLANKGVRFIYYLRIMAKNGVKDNWSGWFAITVGGFNYEVHHG